MSQDLYNAGWDDALKSEEVRAMLAALQGIQTWATMMGGWESPKWEAVDNAVKQAKAVGITPLSNTQEKVCSK